MTTTPGPGRYRLTAFLDTNIILECRDLTDLPWDELDPVGPILLLVTAQTSKEIDARKRDGRLAKRARAFNRLLAEALTNGGFALVRESGPRVELARSRANPILWDRHDDLDPQEADHRIVAEILYAKGVNLAEVVVVSHDINPLALASDHGLRIHHVEDQWLQPAGPSPAEKEMQRLKSRLNVLEAQQPEFEITIELDDADPAELLKIGALSGRQRAELLDVLLEKHPKPWNGSGTLNLDYDRRFDERWNHYVNVVLPAFVDAYTSKLELMYNQRRLKVGVRNSGALQAGDVTIEVTTSDGWLNEAFVFVSPAGPSAPVPRSPMDLSHLTAGIPSIRSHLVGRHEFSWLKAPERTARAIAACAAFHNEQNWVFEGSTLLNAHVEEPAELVVKVRASNLRGFVERRISVAKRIVDTDPFFLDVEELRDRRTPSVLKYILAAWERDENDRVELDGEEG